jgi:hypothetical protein
VVLAEPVALLALVVPLLWVEVEVGAEVHQILYVQGFPAKAVVVVAAVAKEDLVEDQAVVVAAVAAVDLVEDREVADLEMAGDFHFHLDYQV